MEAPDLSTKTDAELIALVRSYATIQPSRQFVLELCRRLEKANAVGVPDVRP